jgi:hypothetical protein
MEQLSFDLTISESYLDPNPMIKVYGVGPNGAKCKTCKHLTSIRPGQNKYYKCSLRGITHGPGTDHRVNWNACGKYQHA